MPALRRYSNEASATPQADLPPTAPTNLTASGGYGVVNLDWGDNTEIDLAGCNVYRSPTAGGPYDSLAVDVTASELVDSTSEGGTTYYYVVTAVDTISQENGYSNEASATPGDQPPDDIDDFLPWNLSESQKTGWQYEVRPP